MSLPEDRGHQRIHCRACGYRGWSEDTGLCPRCPVPAPVQQGSCEGCDTVTRLSRVDLGREDWWLCADCRADWIEAKRLGMP